MCGRATATTGTGVAADRAEAGGGTCAPDHPKNTHPALGKFYPYLAAEYRAEPMANSGCMLPAAVPEFPSEFSRLPFSYFFGHDFRWSHFWVYPVPLRKVTGIHTL